MEEKKSCTNLSSYSEPCSPRKWRCIVFAEETILKCSIFHVLINKTTIVRTCTEEDHHVRVSHATQNLNLLLELFQAFLALDTTKTAQVSGAVLIDNSIGDVTISKHNLLGYNLTSHCMRASYAFRLNVEKDTMRRIDKNVLNSPFQGVLAVLISEAICELRPGSEVHAEVKRIVASDGLWDIMSNQEVCEIARKLVGVHAKKFLKAKAEISSSEDESSSSDDEDSVEKPVASAKPVAKFSSSSESENDSEDEKETLATSSDSSDDEESDQGEKPEQKMEGTSADSTEKSDEKEREDRFGFAPGRFRGGPLGFRGRGRGRWPFGGPFVVVVVVLGTVAAVKLLVFRANPNLSFPAASMAGESYLRPPPHPPSSPPPHVPDPASFPPLSTSLGSHSFAPIPFSSHHSPWNLPMVKSPVIGPSVLVSSSTTTPSLVTAEGEATTTPVSTEQAVTTSSNLSKDLQSSAAPAMNVSGPLLTSDPILQSQPLQNPTDASSSSPSGCSHSEPIAPSSSPPQEDSMAWEPSIIAHGAQTSPILSLETPANPPASRESSPEVSVVGLLQPSDSVGTSSTPTPFSFSSSPPSLPFTTPHSSCLPPVTDDGILLTPPSSPPPSPSTVVFAKNFTKDTPLLPEAITHLLALPAVHHPRPINPKNFKKPLSPSHPPPSKYLLSINPFACLATPPAEPPSPSDDLLCC
ncbi:LOW QUALITY PROTEIN: hypothetical protein HID58_005873 [Brassica napus]|uniref:PPM-type phosphatase domain-containing protein n=1 Tax=Brassica napus TaxID=3708 RepID=A0ABQ8E9T9_BRANA|nr:LOW QUALITY PROTEIN: hypothetical protein HID58_005873 [Brassica napus]